MFNNEQIAEQKEWLLKRVAEAKVISEYEKECADRIMQIISGITYENKDVMKERLKYILRDSGCFDTQKVGEDLRRFAEYL